MEKFIKISVIIAVLIIALSAVYYFVIFLPKTKDAETLSKNQSACAQMEEKALSRYKQETLQISGKNPNLASSSNHYNTKLKKCIVKIFDDSDIDYIVDILDAVENTTLAGCVFYRDPSFPSGCQIGKSFNSTISLNQLLDIIDKKYMTE